MTQDQDENVPCVWCKKLNVPTRLACLYCDHAMPPRKEITLREKKVYRRNIEELAKLIDGKQGRLTKVAGKVNATLEHGRTLRGIISVHMSLFIRCDSPTEYIAITAAKSWVIEDDGSILVTTQNSVWRIELEEDYDREGTNGPLGQGRPEPSGVTHDRA